MKQNLPPRQVAIRDPLVQRRVKAFKVPNQYIADAIVGYQGKEDKFEMIRVQPHQLPEGFSIVRMYEAPNIEGVYVVIEHPSFPEHVPGTDIPLLELILEGITVERVKEQPSLDPPRSHIPVIPLTEHPTDPLDPDELLALRRLLSEYQQGNPVKRPRKIKPVTDKTWARVDEEQPYADYRGLFILSNDPHSLDPASETISSVYMFGHHATQSLFWRYAGDM
jgi:hypothetical protein